MWDVSSSMAALLDPWDAIAMTDRRGLTAEHTALGLAIATLGCTPPGPGFTLDDEGETGGDGDGDDDPPGDGDTDTGPNDVPFELVLGALNATGKFVVLRFSEAIGPVDGVDPSDFRISFARISSQCDYYGGCFYQTTYWDPNFFAHNYIQYQPYSDERFEVDLVTAGMQPTDVFLRFEQPLDPIVCEYTGYGGEYDVLFVHYSPGNIPLTSSDDESLAAIGLQWVEQPDPVWSVEGQFPDLDPKIAIPCSL